MCGRSFGGSWAWSSVGPGGGGILEVALAGAELAQDHHVPVHVREQMAPSPPTGPPSAESSPDTVWSTVIAAPPAVGAVT